MDASEITQQYEKLNLDFEILKSLLTKQPYYFLTKIQKLEMIIKEKIPTCLEKNAPANFPELYREFVAEYNRFRDYMLFEPLIGKKVVALGGGFSSGKSTFLNVLMNKRVLPTEIQASTSVPAYIVHGNEETAHALNMFDSSIEISVDVIRKLQHGFGSVEDEEGVDTKEVSLGHILKSVFLEMPTQKYEHIAFLDTPGYSKADSNQYDNEKTDERIAYAQLNTSNFILWFIQADAGTILEGDIEFIKSLNRKIPVLFIINKADKKPIEDINRIKEVVKDILTSKGMVYVDVLAFSRKRPLEYDGEKIYGYLKQWNEANASVDFAHNFKKIFFQCKKFYDEKEIQISKNLNRINTAMTLASEDDVMNCLKELQELMQDEKKKNKEAKERLKKLQDEFFAEIKCIADTIHISMPEPSEIDFLKDQLSNPVEVMAAYKMKHPLKENESLKQEIMSLLSGISCDFYRYQVGKDRETLIRNLSRTLSVRLSSDKNQEFGKN